MGKKRKFNESFGSNEDVIKQGADEQLKEERENVLKSCTFSLGQKVGMKRNFEKRLIVILERANLESVKNGRSYELINSDDHKGLIKRHNKDIKDYRPDILHQCLLMLQDSPLNQAGLLQVYIHTEKNILIEVHPQCRIPRTYKRFAGLIVQLLHRFSVRDQDGKMKLLKVIKNPVQDYLPVGCKKIGTSFSSKILISPKDLVPADEPFVIVIGAMAHGKVETEYVEEEYSFSSYHLSAALTCAKVCSAFEEVWVIK